MFYTNWHNTERLSKKKKPVQPTRLHWQKPASGWLGCSRWRTSCVLLSPSVLLLPLRFLRLKIFQWVVSGSFVSFGLTESTHRGASNFPCNLRQTILVLKGRYPSLQSIRSGQFQQFISETQFSTKVELRQVSRSTVLSSLDDVIENEWGSQSVTSSYVYFVFFSCGLYNGTNLVGGFLNLTQRDNRVTTIVWSETRCEGWENVPQLTWTLERRPLPFIWLSIQDRG